MDNIQAGLVSILMPVYNGEQYLRQAIDSALAQTYAIREDDLALQALLADAVCLVHEGDYNAAIEISSLIQHHPVSWNETKLHAGEILEIASSHLAEAAVQRALERGKALDLDSLVENVLNQ